MLRAMGLESGEDLAHVGPCGAERARALRQSANGLVRRWLGGVKDTDLLAAIDAIGAESVRTAADLTRRFGGAVDLSGRAEQTLEALRQLVEAIHSASPRRRFGLFAGPTPSMEARLNAAEPRLTVLLEQLAGQHDQLSREVIRLRGLLEELAQSDRMIEEAVHLSRALEGAFEAAARELDGSDPARAAQLRGALGVRLTERLRDLLTQLVVVRQGRLSLASIADGQEALARAIERTRLILLAALRTAVAARRSAAQGRAAPASTGAEPERETDLGRAIAAMRSAFRTDPAP
jgi:hypothetical protein